MTDKPLGEWPSYRPEHKDHLHAIGVITSRFNDLEFLLFSVFKRQLCLKPETARRVFVLLQNFNRLDLIRAELESEKDPELKELVEYFLDGYSVIADNRNFLAHSSINSTESDPQNMVLGKGSKKKPSAIGYLSMTVTDLRRVADEIQEFCNFCVGIEVWWAAKHGKFIGADGPIPPFSVPLPNKPPAPIPLKGVPRAPRK